MRTLYLHIDRSYGLSSGDVLELQPCPGESELPSYASMFADGFMDHIADLCEEGLSYHGRQYLVKFFESEIYTPLLFKEFFLEFVRWECDIDEPSRFQSFFAWGKYEDALNFAKLLPKNKEKDLPIYEVEPLGRVFKGDMNLTRVKADKRIALFYWRGDRLENKIDYTPLWEYVLEMPVRIIRKC